MISSTIVKIFGDSLLFVTMHVTSSTPHHYYFYYYLTFLALIPFSAFGMVSYDMIGFDMV